MNTPMFLRAAVTRWYAALLGILLTVSAAYLVYTDAPTSYWSQSSVSLLQPQPNPLTAEGHQLADLASALVIRVNGEPAESKTSSPETALFGEGIREGTRIRIRDVGRQWVTSIPDPIILVEAVGSNPERVSSQISAQVDTLQTHLDELQGELKVRSITEAFMRVAPEAPTVQAVEGSRIRAAAAVTVIGCIITGVALHLLNQYRPALSPRNLRRRTLRAPTHSHTTEVQHR